jgi:dephospho-CoA kinase
MKIIGITGTLASGKASVKDFFLSRFPSSYFISLSDIIKEELLKEGKELKRENFIEKGNELRKRYGSQILVEVATLTLPKNTNNLIVIIDGVRNVLGLYCDCWFVYVWYVCCDVKCSIVFCCGFILCCSVYEYYDLFVW